MTTLAEQYEEIAVKKRAEARAVDLRHELAGVHRQLDRVAKRFSAGADLLSTKDAERTIRLCELILQLESVDKSLGRLSPVESLPYRAAVVLVRDLRVEMAAALNGNAAVVAIAGRSEDPYGSARRVLYFTNKATKPSKAATGKGIAADMMERTGQRKRSPSSKGRKLATVGVAVRALRTKSADGTPRILATASSTALDLEGDTFDVKALRQMRSHFAKGANIFLNHSYQVPRDLAGRTESAKLTQRDGRTDLDLVILVEKGNVLAMQTYEYVRGGATLGVSVGVIVNESERIEGGGVNILDCIPLEASLVGIPANQTAWTQGAKS